MSDLSGAMERIVDQAFDRRFERYITEGVLLHGHHVDASGATWNSPLDQIDTHMKMRDELKSRGFTKKKDASEHHGEIHAGKVEGVPHKVELKFGKGVISSDVNGSMKDGEYEPSGVNMEIGSASSPYDLGRQLDMSAAAAKGNS